MLDARLARFLIVGMANTIAGLLVIFVCKGLMGMGDIMSNLLGYGIGIALGFLLNKRWTFEYVGGTCRAFWRYLVVVTLAYGANLATVLFGIVTLHLNSYLAQAAGILPYTVVSYLGSRFIVFNTHQVGMK
jgi:putative flippase GtrA